MRFVAEASPCKYSITVHAFHRLAETMVRPEIEFVILSDWSNQLLNCFDNQNAHTYTSKTHLGKNSDILLLLVISARLDEPNIR